MDRQLAAGLVHIVIAVVFTLSALRVIPSLDKYWALLLFLVGGYFMFQYFRKKPNSN